MKTSFLASVDAQTVAKRLSQLKLGDSVTYEDLTRLVPGRDIKGKHRGILDTARRIVLREDGIVTGPINGTGIQRLTDSQILEIPQFAMNKARRIVNRASKKTICADYEKLSSEEKIKFNAGLSMLGVIEQFSKPKAREVIEEKVKTTSARLSLEDTLSQFSKK